MIWFFGTSHTFGICRNADGQRYVPVEQSYSNLVGEALGEPVLNFAHPGDQNTYMIARMQAALDSDAPRPDTVIIEPRFWPDYHITPMPARCVNSKMFDAALRDLDDKRNQLDTGWKWIYNPYLVQTRDGANGIDSEDGAKRWRLDDTLIGIEWISVIKNNSDNITPKAFANHVYERNDQYLDPRAFHLMEELAAKVIDSLEFADYRRSTDTAKTFRYHQTVQDRHMQMEILSMIQLAYAAGAKRVKWFMWDSQDSSQGKSHWRFPQHVINTRLTGEYENLRQMIIDKAGNDKTALWRCDCGHLDHRAHEFAAQRIIKCLQN